MTKTRNLTSKINHINNEILSYTHKFEQHPITKLCQARRIPRSVLDDFAKLQFIDSILWVPMLALIKGKVKSPRLAEAVRKNLLCEAGVDGIPHVTLCQEFSESLGIIPRYGDYNDFCKYASHPVEVMMSLQDCSEPFIAGWLLAAETLVPTLFRIFKTAYESIATVDFRYFNEHISVDSDEHSEWMREAVEELMMQSDCFEEIMFGVDMGGRIALSIPDVLFSKTIRLQKQANSY